MSGSWLSAEGLGCRVCRRMAHKWKYPATVNLRVYRDLTIRCWSLNVEGFSFLLSHPTPSEAAKPPKPIPFRV